MALSNLALFGGAFFTPVVVGKITHTIGWEWSFYLIAIFSGALLPLVIFFVPETAYRRNSSLNTDYVVEESISKTDTEKRASTSLSRPDSIDNRPNERDNRHLTSQADDIFVPLKISFARSLLPFNGRKTDENLFKLVLRPLPLFFHPAIFWACLIQGALIGWTVMIGIVLAAIFLGPPLWFDEVKTGYMYTGPLVGAILGFLVAGLFSDWSTKLMIRRNRGVYEPEFRILLVIPQLIFGCAGLYGFGITSNHVTSWFWPDFFFALEVMGMVLGAVASALYIVDAHRKLLVPIISMYTSDERYLPNFEGDIAVEAFTCLLIFKNMFSFGLTWSAYNWLITAGISKSFYIIASVQVGVCLLSIPMCKLRAKPPMHLDICDNKLTVFRRLWQEEPGIFQST